MKRSLFIVAVSGAILIGCNNKKEQTPKEDSSNVVEQIQNQSEHSISEYILNVSDVVEGYDAKRHEFSIEEDGSYTITMKSDNIGSMFVVQNMQGDNVVPDSGESWTGELKKGDYVVVAGLTRNAARKDNAVVNYTLTIK